jgi:hypothetical protein
VILAKRWTHCHSADSVRGLERAEEFSVSKGAEWKEPEGEKIETEEVVEFADDEGSQEEGNTESSLEDETRDDNEGRDGEDESEDDAVPVIRRYQRIFEANMRHIFQTLEDLPAARLLHR